MKITCWKVHNLAGAIVGSGLPMTVGYSPEKFSLDERALEEYLHLLEETKNPETSLLKMQDKAEIVRKHLKRAKMLASAGGGESHDCFLCGILISMNISAPKKWWEEFQRYHFNEIVSATSTMHKAGPIIIQPDLSNAFEPSVLEEPEIKAFIERKAAEYEQNKDSKKWLDSLRFCLPLGTIQTAHVISNYRSMKTMCHQRKNHPLEEWREFVKWARNLPLAEELIFSHEEKKED